MIVIKIGGGKSLNLQSISSDIAIQSIRQAQDKKFIIIHGGNYYLDFYSQKLGIEKKMLTLPSGMTSRYTTRETIELMYMTYAGLANKKIVESLLKSGVNAIGLSGVDGRLIVGKKHEALITVEGDKKKVVKDDLTGNVESINLDLLNLFLDKGIIPVITPPVITQEGEVINVDGDKIASKIATDFKSEVLLFLIEAPGILKDLNDESSLIKEVNKGNLDELVNIVSGRMKRKLLECSKLLDLGIGKIIITDGRVENPISAALNGGGTHIYES